MSPPPYARPTASSTQKESLRASKLTSPKENANNQTPYTPARKLKRPSTLTPEHRQSIAYNASLYPIKPQDPQKPCLLASLPSELRTHIYTYILSSDPGHIFKRRPCNSTPPLLHVSRAIRIEAAYVHYTSTPFTFSVRNFDFHSIRNWITHLPAPHRALLVKNRHLTIRVIPDLLYSSFVYPRGDWLLDGRTATHWKACAPYGNIYAVNGADHRIYFLTFCRLLSWFRFVEACKAGLKWRYDFDSHLPIRNYRQEVDAVEAIANFVNDNVGVLGKRCVGMAWTKGRDGKGRDEAMRFLGHLEVVLKKMGEWKVCDEAVSRNWEVRMRRLKRAVEKW
jgi:hypothetical protein